MKTSTKVGIGFGIAAAIGLVYVATKKPSTDKQSSSTKRSALKTAVTETAGEEKAAAVDNMSDDEVETVMKTIAPEDQTQDSGSDGGGGGDMTSNPPVTTTTPPRLVYATIPNAVLSPVLQTRTRGNKPRSFVISHITPHATRATTIVKRGVGAIDGTDCVSILKKHGIM